MIKERLLDDNYVVDFTVSDYYKYVWNVKNYSSLDSFISNIPSAEVRCAFGKQVDHFLYMSYDDICHIYDIGNRNSIGEFWVSFVCTNTNSTIQYYIHMYITETKRRWVVDVAECRDVV